MEITVEDKIKQTPDWDTAVYGATKILEEYSRATRANVRLDWGLVWHEDRFPGFRLRITDDEGGEAEGRFSLEELRDGRRLGPRLNRLWDDVLRKRSHKILARLRHLVANLEED